MPEDSRRDLRRAISSSCWIHHHLGLGVALALGLTACTGYVHEAGTDSDDAPPPFEPDASMAEPDAGSAMPDAGTPVEDSGTTTADTSIPDTGPMAADTAPPPVVDDDVSNTAHCAPAAGWGDAVSAEEYEVLRLVNEARARGETCGGEAFGPTTPLSMSPKLRCAARLHARDMGENGYFDHTALDGSSVGVRANRAEYEWRGVGENIARGQANASRVVQGWIDSAGHCRNIMNPSYEDIGVGFWEADGRNWVQVFGRPR